MRSRLHRMQPPSGDRWPRRAALALVALALAACSSSTTIVGARFGGPAGIVAFTGLTNKNVDLHPYLAVASSRGDELVFIDPADNQPVLGPGVVFPLSIPTQPRPLRVAAASLGDRVTGGADLLVAVSASSLDLQVIETWTPLNRVVPAASVALAPVLGEGEILSLLAVTPPGAVPGSARARVLVAASGGRLVVIDFTRDAQTGGVIPGQPILKTIGIDADAMALEPDGTRVFMATRDPMTDAGGASVSGVGFVDAGLDAASPWTVTPIGAGAPTVALAVARVNERIVDPTNPASPDTFDPVAQLRIYAVLDPAACGPERAIGCGVAMLGEQGLLPDPAGELPHRAPLPVPGAAAGIAVALPPASGSHRILGDPSNPSLVLTEEQPSGKLTAAIAAVTSSDGNVYLYDLSRFGPLDAGSTLSSPGISSALSVPPADAGVEGSANFGKTTQLGLWNDFATPPPAGTPAAVVIDPGTLAAAIQTTPGHTLSDQWLVTWQGQLPGLHDRRAVVGRLATGETYVAVQANAGTAAQPQWVNGVSFSDPALGVHGGDVVVVVADDPALCPAGADPTRPANEAVVAADVPVLPADPALFPGGALKLASGTCFDAAIAPGQSATATVTVRASALVLTSELLGYMGRPALDQPFVLQYQDETALTGEALAIDRKLRRRFYPADAPCPVAVAGQGPAPGCYGAYPWLADPLAPGPTLAFRAGLTRSDLPAGTVSANPADPAVLQTIPRDARLIIRTAGSALTSVRPQLAGVLPGSVLSFDKTQLPGHENDATRFYAAYRDDQLLDFTPSLSGYDPKQIR